MADEEQLPPEQPPSEIIIEPDKLAGVWANFAQVSHTIHEFTIDFVRLDPTVPGRGIVVARVAVSPLFITQLLEALGDQWNQYAKRALPKEVFGDEQGQNDQDPSGEGT